MCVKVGRAVYTCVIMCVKVGRTVFTCVIQYVVFNHM